ncbi:hypothetical protein [Hyphomicrobium sp. DY-1]|uniref:hypothetical protein n=1 Tax=Hyphomicrobium sp. DY-1 TaxID=3075650 RepID=UPI0039C31AC9
MFFSLDLFNSPRLQWRFEHPVLFWIHARVPSASLTENVKKYAATQEKISLHTMFIQNIPTPKKIKIGNRSSIRIARSLQETFNANLSSRT